MNPACSEGKAANLSLWPIPEFCSHLPTDPRCRLRISELNLVHPPELALCPNPFVELGRSFSGFATGKSHHPLFLEVGLLEDVAAHGEQTAGRHHKSSEIPDEALLGNVDTERRETGCPESRRRTAARNEAYLVKAGHQVVICSFKEIRGSHRGAGIVLFRDHLALGSERLTSVMTRPAQAEDIAALCSLDPVVQAGDAERRTAISTHVTNRHMLVAVVDSDVAGYVVMLPGHFLGCDFIELLVVANAHRRIGLATRLNALALEGATSRQVFTSTNVSNNPMKALLRKRGWSFSGTLDGFDVDDPEQFFYLDV